VNRLSSPLYRALYLVWQSSPRLVLLEVGLLVVQGILPLAHLYLMKQLIDVLTQGLAPTAGTAPPTVQLVLGLTVLMAIATLLSDGCAVASKLTQAIQTEAVSDRVHRLLHAKSIQVDLDYYENTDHHNTLHRAQSAAPYRPQIILSGLLQVAQSSLSLLGVVALLITLHWMVPLFLLGTTIPGLLIRVKYTGKTYGRIRTWTERERQANYFHTLLTTAPYAKEIRLFNLGGLFSQWFQTLRHSIRREKIHLATQQTTVDLITQGSATVAVSLACGLTAYQTLQGTITLGGFVMYYQAFQRGQGFLRELLSHCVSLYENSLFLQDFYHFLDLKPTITEPIHAQPVPHTWKTGLRFENVSFDYPHSQRTVLRNINLTLHPGETIALVGANGAGKTTLIKLLCRLYDPTAGRITLDGIDLRQFSVTELRRYISVLFQDYTQYQRTAQDNIWFGNTDLAPTAPQIHQAAIAAGAAPVIQQLPQGYATPLGNQFADGEELSLGQWQKIALARSFLRSAPLLILDEPTSALDPKAEADVFDRFRHLVKDRTAVIISHRLSTTKLADRIVVIADGEIAESGTHSELMHHNGLYAHLFTTQAHPYTQSIP
jgi:ATP-binding cassette, subfamily B, bacterial